MAEQPDNIALEHLRLIREVLARVEAEQREQRGRLGTVEQLLGRFEVEMAETRAEIVSLRADLGGRLDRVTDRLDRIERCLNLVDA